MGNRLEGKVAIVTGAGRGIGRAEALALAAEGCRVLVNDYGGGPFGEQGSGVNPADEVVAEVKKMGGDGIANYDSVSDYAAGERMVQSCLDRWGRLDILVNNAGILRDRMIFNMTEEDWDLVIAVHLKGHFTVTRPASALFRQQRGGRIINTSSESGLGNMGQANYSAAKEAIIGLTRTIARDLGRYGVTVNAIRPRAGTRLTLSDQLRQANPQIAQMLAQQTPEMVAPLVAYLATDKAANVNGRNFLVGGDLIGLYSEPDVVKQMTRAGGWTVDAIEQEFEKQLGPLVNPWAPKPAS